MTNTLPMVSFADAERVLAESLPGYESRPPQQALAAIVEKSLLNETHVIAEAGCGVGKSMGTAIPAILSGKRVVMSTATKALQGQIAEKDLPFLQEHLGVDFSFALLKGRSNYLCLSNLVSEQAQEISEISVIINRSKDDDFDGTREDLGLDVDNMEWLSLTTSSEECPGASDCAFGETCYAEKAKKNAQESDIVVVNHALLITEMILRDATEGAASMIGSFDSVVIDEAHELGDITINMLSSRITEAGIGMLCSEASNFAGRHDMDLGDLAQEVRDAAYRLWNVSNDEGDLALEEGRINSDRILQFGNEWVGLANSLHDLHAEFSTAKVMNATETSSNKRFALSNRIQKTAQTLVDIIVGQEDDIVRWIEEETTRRGDRVFMSIKSAPVDAGPSLSHLLFSHTPSILVSATMSVDGSMDYIAGEVGLNLEASGGYESLAVGTPFNFTDNALLYVPRRLPAPAGKTRVSWESMVIGEMRELIMASSGRALLLFTSVSQMKAVRRELEDIIPFNTFMQGEEPNSVLAEKFKADTSSVLFATRSFFTGVDFPGETLSLVIINKLPFPVPVDPMVEAKCDKIRRKGGSDFSEYTIPVMSLVLAQAFGRLIRSTTDRGVVAILDSRILTKGYGSKIVKSLPDAPVVESLSDVREFFSAS